MMPNQMHAAIPQQQVPQWQGPPPLAHVASGVQPKPIKARGVSATPQPQPVPSAVQRYVLPSPQSLGVSTSLSIPESKSPAQVIDWNELQTRMARLGVLRYQKQCAENGTFHVTMLFPTADPTKGQPMSAQADTEAAAVVMILNYAEEWSRKR